MFLANISSAPGRPSFFEMIAQHEMMPTLRPAIKYIFSVRTSNFLTNFHRFLETDTEDSNGLQNEVMKFF